MKTLLVPSRHHAFGTTVDLADTARSAQPDEDELEVATTRALPRTVVRMSQYMAWPTADGVWHIGTGLTLPPDASLADLDKLLTKRHIDRAQIGFHRPNDETRFNEQFAPATAPDQP